MMKFIKYTLIILSLASCKQKSEVISAKVYNPEKIRIDLTDTSTVFIDDIADSIRVLSLSNTDSVSLSGVAKYFNTTDGMVVSDIQASAAYIFNNNGALVKTIKPKAKKSVAPRKYEFRFMNDVFYDSKANLIEVLDLSSECIFRFDTKGNIHDTLVVNRSRPMGSQYVAVNNEYVSLLFNYNTDKHLLSIYQRDGKVLNYNSQKLNTIPFLKHMTILTHHQLDVYQDSIYCFPELEDKIYRVSSTDTVPVYVLDYPNNKKLTDAVKNAHPTRDLNTYYKTMENSNLIFGNNSLFINDEWVYFKFLYRYKNLPRNVLYCKQSKQIIQFSRLKSKKYPNLRFVSIAGKDQDFFVAVNAIIKGKKTKAKNSPRYVDYQLIFFKPKQNTGEAKLAAR